MILYYTGADVVCVYLDYGVCVWLLHLSFGPNGGQDNEWPRWCQCQPGWVKSNIDSSRMTLLHLAVSWRLSLVVTAISILQRALPPSCRTRLWTPGHGFPPWHVGMIFCGAARNYMTMLSFLKVAAASHAVVTWQRIHSVARQSFIGHVIGMTQRRTTAFYWVIPLLPPPPTSSPIQTHTR